MIVRTVLFLAFLLIPISVITGVHAAEWYVDGSVAESGDGTTWETAFETIQDGINAASDGDTVIVAEGTYVENISFDGKSIILTSTDPLDPAVVQNTVIDGNQSGSVVTFDGTEDETCVLSGFTIRNGKADYSGICGGTLENQTRATIQNCVITANSDGAMCLCSGIIRDNTIIGNSGSYGAGLGACNGIVENNIIRGNAAEYYGGGLDRCHGTIRNNIINNNTADYGGGLYDCDGTIQGNTITDNSANQRGGGLYGCEGTILNSIIWGNTPVEQICESSTATYSCIQRWIGGGEGSMDYYPHFVDAANGDYHLENWSPCIDAGDPTFPYSQEPEPNGGRINMGAFGNTSQAASKSPDTDQDGLPDDWEIEFFGDLSEGATDDSDGDFTPNTQEHYRGLNPTIPDPVWYVDSLVPASGDGTSWETAFQTIGEGISAASNGHTVVVAPGTYLENIKLRGKNITLRSTDPLDPDVVANTIIDGQQAGPVVTFDAWQHQTCTLSGFTIQNGEANNGGGIYGGGTSGEHTHATIQNNVIRDNSASNGGGLSFCDGLILNNTISGNSASWGGGMYRSDGAIQGNTFSGNSATTDGGALYHCDGPIQNNTITDNSSERGGSGICNCYGLIENNIISRNSGHGLSDCRGAIENNIISDNSGIGLSGCDYVIWNNIISGNSKGGLSWCRHIIGNIISGNSKDGDGGGLFRCSTIQKNIICGNSAQRYGGGLYDCSGGIQCNIICGNSAGDEGGGLYSCYAYIHNNTIVGNSAGAEGGGLSRCLGATFNSIIWGNTAPEGPQLDLLSSPPTYSCIQGWTRGGEGNIAEDPQFVDRDGPDEDPNTYEDNDYHLLLGSTCIDVGMNEDWMWRASDLDGNPRIFYGGLSLTVDMGAYEYGSWPFRMVKLVRAVGQVELTWSSRPGDTYTIQSCTDLSNGQWNGEETVPSGGESTTWTDPDNTSPRKFYRVGLE